jgi:two-component system LytT family sensor kinase
MTENSKRTWFWPIQLAGWFLIALANFLVQYWAGLPAPILYMNVVGMAGGGLLITTVYRYYLKKQDYKFDLNARRFIGFLLLCAFLQSICWLIFVILITLPFQKKYAIDLISISPNIVPFFILALIWNVIYLGYHLLKQFHQTEVERWKLESAIQKAQLGALKAQINPHFMFNALNNIRALILENPSQARDMITRFSELFRYALQHSEDKEATAAAELSILNQYLELLKIQYENKLHYTIDADEHLLDELIPPMVFQLLVENAVKHGIGLSSKGGEVWISLKKLESRLILSVKNTGSMQQSNNLEESLGIGLNNIKERLKLLYGDKAFLLMKEEANFVTVTISLEK